MLNPWGFGGFSSSIKWNEMNLRQFQPPEAFNVILIYICMYKKNISMIVIALYAIILP